jgi:hypothetical protein
LVLHEGFQVGVEAVEAGVPELAVAGHPFGGFAQGGGLEVARAPLGFAAAGDQSGLFEDLQVFGDGREAQGEGFGDLVDACRARIARLVGSASAAKMTLS